MAEDGLPKKVQELIDRTRTLSDEERRAIAIARADRDEAFRVGAWRAAMEAIGQRPDLYQAAWVKVGSAYVPERLEELINLGSRADADEVAEWQGVARLVRLAIDEALLALLTSDTIPPPHLRELIAPWKAMLEEAGPSTGSTS